MTADQRAYHHGDLRNALLQAGAELAESGGPDAVTIRAAARSAGVTPTAAYRHFADHADLLSAVRGLAMQRLAAAMTRYLRRLPPADDPITAAVDRMRSTGRGYIQFALAEPGLFRTAFAAGSGPFETDGRGPFDLLGAALDGLVDVGLLAPEDRPRTEFAAWSAVHGVAVLLIDGPLGGLSRRERDAVIDRVLEVVHRGLTTGRKRSAGRGRGPG